MKKLIFSQLLLFLSFSAIFSQTLDEQVAQAVKKNLPEWKAENSPTPFKVVRQTFSPSLEGRWSYGSRKASLVIYTEKSAAETDSSLKSFLMRQIIPANRKIENLGDNAVLVETAKTVEIAFAKANVLAILEVDFPDLREDKIRPYYYAPAPKKEIENALKFARVVAGAIEGEKTVSSCFNNFYRPQTAPASSSEDKLFTAVSNGDAETVKSLISQNVNVDHIFPDGETALHSAVRQGCFEIVKTLVSAKTDVNAKTAKGVTPLMIAANLGDLELSKYLVSSGADVRAKDIYGRSTAFFVTGYQQSERIGAKPITTEQKLVVLKYLVSQGININDRESLDGNTLLISLLHDCLGSSDCKVLANTILDLGADINAENKQGETALIKAIDRINATKRDDFVKFLLTRGADVNHKDKKGLSPLGYALRDGKIYAGDAYFSKYIAETIALLKNAGAIE
jgi:ankyrin repeat protein